MTRHILDEAATGTTDTDAAHAVGRVVPTLAREARTVLTAALGGVALGIAARAWMRLIAEDPGYTRSGTIFIISGFTVFATTQALARVIRRRARRRVSAAAARVVATIGLMPLFIGAGAQMLPTVVGAGFAQARPTWPRAARVACLAVAAVPVLVVTISLQRSFGWSARSGLGIAVLVALYATIGRVARPAFEARLDGRRVHPVVAGVAVSVLALVLGVLMMGVAGS